MTAQPFRHLRFESIDSTNAEARRLAEKGEGGPLWISSGIQTAGRGRRGRDWVSKSGNLYATLLQTLPVLPATAAQASFVTALAVHDACQQFLPPSSDLSLKWPNDLLLEQEKLVGILLETVPCDQPDKMAVAIGCGINLNHAPSHTNYGATWLNAHTAQQVTAEQLLEKLTQTMKERLDQWKCGEGFDLIIDAWQNRASHLGEVISLIGATETVSGKFLQLATDGALTLELEDGRIRHFHAGDVSFRPNKTTGNTHAG